MIKDEIGGKATNLTPLINHQMFMVLLQKKLKLLIEDTDPMAKLWLDYGVDRKICKKPVMCLPYSLTQYSCSQYLEDHVVKEYVERNKKHDSVRIYLNQHIT